MTQNSRSAYDQQKQAQNGLEDHMIGRMQSWSLLIHRIIDHAAIQHGTRGIVTRSVEGPLRRST